MANDFKDLLEKYKEVSQSERAAEKRLRESIKQKEESLRKLRESEEQIDIFLDIHGSDPKRRAMAEDEMGKNIDRQSSVGASIENDKEKLNLEKNLRLSQAKKSFVSSVEKVTGTSRSGALTQSELAKTIGLLNQPTSVLEEKIRSAEKHNKPLLESVRDYAKKIGSSDFSEEEFLKKAGAAENLQHPSVYSAAIRMQKRRGIDDESLFGKYSGFLDKYSKDVNYGNVEKQAKGELKEGTLTAKKAFEELSEAAEKLKMALEEVTQKEYKSEEEAIAAKKKLSEAFAEAEVKQTRYTIADRNGSNKDYNDMKSFASIASTGASAVRALFIDQPLQDARNKMGYLDMANQQFNDIGASVGGDQAAMMRVMGLDSFRKNFSAAMYRRMQGVRATETAAQGASDAADIVGNATDVGGDIVKTKLQAAAGVIKLAGNAAVNGADITQGISAGAKGVEVGSLAKEMFNTISAIPAAQRQAWWDQTSGAYSATTGLGNSQMLGALTDFGGFRKQAASLNMGMAELAQLTSMAGGAIGGKDLTSEMLLKAGFAEKSGLLSSQSYVGLQGLMTDVGGSNKDMESALRKAVAAGLDDSKNIERMIQYTSAMAERDTVSGVSTVSDIQGLSTMASMADSLKGMTTSAKGRAIESTMRAIDQEAQHGMGDKNIYSYQEFSELAKALPGASAIQLSGLQKGGIGMLAKLSSGLRANTAEEQTKFKDEMDKMGFGNLFFDKNGKIKEDALKGVINAGTSQIFGAKTQALTMSNMGAGEWLDKIISGKASKQEMADARVQMNASGMNLDAFVSIVKGLRSGQAVSEKEIAIAEGRGDAANAMSPKAIYEAGLAGKGKQQIDKMGGLKTYGVLQQGIAEAGIDFDVEKAQSEATKLDAPSSVFDKSANVFKGSTDKFEKAVKDFESITDKMGVLVGGSSVKQAPAANTEYKRNIMSNMGKI